MPRRRPLILLLAITALVCVPGSAVASPPSSRVLRDCNRHHGTLAGRFSRHALSGAYRRLLLDHLQFENCGLAIASQQAGSGRAGRPRVAAVVADCLHHGGRLTRRYPPPTLRRAYRTLDLQLRTETRCPVGIASQFNGRRRSGVAALLPPLEVRSPGRVNITEGQTISLLARAVAAFARPAVASDAPTGAIRGLVQSANAAATQRGDPPVADPDRARAIGPDANMFVLPGPGETCRGLQVGRSAALACGSAAMVDQFTGAALTVGHGGLILWGLVPDGTHAFRLLTEDGTWMDIRAVRNGLEQVITKVPRLLTWRDGKGTTHYQDFTQLGCLLVACPD